MAKAGLQRFKGMHAKAQGQSESQRDMRISQFMACTRRRAGCWLPMADCLIVAGFNSRQDLTNRNCTSLILTARLGYVKKMCYLHLYWCVECSKEMEMAWPHVVSW